MLVKLYGSTIVGINAISIGIEVNVSAGTNYYIVGLPDSAIKESLQRVESAIKHSGYKMPRTKIVINLFPADIRKTGSAFDLPIAIGILVASNQCSCLRPLEDYVIMGELGLDGTIHKIVGSLPIALQARRDQQKGIIIPKENAPEAAIVEEAKVYGMNSLRDVVLFLEGEEQSPTVVQAFSGMQKEVTYDLDFSDVKGQQMIKRSLEIAAAGGHNVILIGPPGAGKTMLAKRIPTILPPFTFSEAIETTQIYSIAGLLKGMPMLMQRPFRSPHHTVSDVALVGGGSDPSPGEISLAHNGVLFLDELPEFKRTVLEVLRQPIEDGHITISRAKMAVEFPAHFMLVASMNPCPCGYFNHPEKKCTCPPSAVERYLQKISGPLLDRIDLHVEVTPVPVKTLTTYQTEERSESIRERIIKARHRQAQRYPSNSGKTMINASLSSKQIKEYCQLDQISTQLLKNAIIQLSLSARAYDRILKVARTIADLAEKDNIHAEHLAEAIQFRCLDREKWMR